jgi:hypothetical protein
VADLDFFSDAWAEAVRAAVDSGPGEVARAAKLPTYWEWVDRARQGYTQSWLLSVRDLPTADGVRQRGVLLRWTGGACSEVSVVDGDAEADYVVSADYADWRELLGGYDPARLVMYRRFLLEHGVVLTFFRRIYFFTESLACVAGVPTTFDQYVLSAS